MQLTTMFISKPLLADLRICAKAEDRSMASIVREAITQWLLRSGCFKLQRNTKPLPPGARIKRPTKRRK
jgi:hypothetical protein